jgi:UDP-N-acetylmuramoyl-tripeptide--D-alanyl-D-alanine ligase
MIVVEDTLAALGRLGSSFRHRWPLEVVGITGSAGKTTTKEFTADLLAARRSVYRSEGNFNNLYGLPLTLTRRRPEHDLAVLEIGMSTPGELGRIAAIAQPDVAVITNVGRAHHMNFADLEAIAREKASLLDHTRAEGAFVANADDPRVLAMTKSFKGRVVRYGFGPETEIRAEDLRAEGPHATRFTLCVGSGSEQASLGSLGRHLVSNALAALGVAAALGLDPLALAPRLAALTPGAGRGRLLLLGQDVLVLDDSYNANPEAVLAATETLPRGARRTAVLGDMLELGDEAEAAHDEVGRHLASHGYALVVGVGPLASRAARTAGRQGVPEIREAGDAAEAAALVQELVRPGDAVLVKGSRAVGLEGVVKTLEEAFGKR